MTIVNTHQVNKNTILSLLNDSIIFYRIADSFSSAMRAFEPMEQYDRFTPSLNFNGFETIFDLMNLEDLEKFGRIREDLTEIGWKFCENTDAADVVAKQLYQRWILELKEKSNFQEFKAPKLSLINNN
jgi:pyruvate-formate lyase